MKLVLALAILLITHTGAYAQNSSERADARVNCAFGESTADLDDHLELPTGTQGKIWYKGEHLSLHNKARLRGLTSAERKMILLAASEGSGQSDKETLKDFAGSDGYLTYFSHNSQNRDFVIVASYPGDNEFGVILEVKKLSRKSEYTVLSVAAVISDGDLEDCRVSKDEVRE